MTATDWLTTAAGVLLVSAGLREVFSTLLHPKGFGRLTPAVFRAVWGVTRRAGHPSFGIAGPLAMVLSFVLWALLLVAGWALVLWPHLPGGFQIADGIRPADQGGFLDAVYVSGVALATLGFGDVVAETTPLRLALVLEAMIGFLLLTASITWVLSVYPALLRRRALAARLTDHLPADGSMLAEEPPAVRATVLYELAAQLAAVQVDLLQYPSSYFFLDPEPRLALHDALRRLDRALPHEDAGDPLEPAEATVREALDGLAVALREGPFGLHGETTTEALAAYAASHRPGRGG